jgi:N-methylhydantoinase A/oxoprolinase/acetone carboxylase beta subunit
MSLLLGIDTGGTFTDAVLLDEEQGVVSSAKAMTTKRDLSRGIKKAVGAVLPHDPSEIKLVSLSTTLATNAIVEQQGSPICLLLLGYDDQVMKDIALEKILNNEAVAFIDGGHSVTGDEQCPLDITAVKEAIERNSERASAFAVSGYFSVRNPEHELRVMELVRELTGLPVSCGHELSSNLNAPRRALTAALNARIIPLIRQLVTAVSDTMADNGIIAPMMIVKGDGSLMDARMALDRPVETILSGPAASVVGACYLNQADDGFVIDMGGTTTDIAVLADGRPRLNLDGATVGEWKTMVAAIDARTTGLGGDSEVKRNGTDLYVGPNRVIPLSILARDNTGIIEVLKEQCLSIKDNDDPAGFENMGCFVKRQQQVTTGHGDLSFDHQKILDLVDKGPLPLPELFENFEYPSVCRRYIGELAERGLVILSAFTPTDAAHVLGRYEYGSMDAARYGAELLAKQMGMDAIGFCNRVIQQVMVQIGRAVIDSVIAGEKKGPKKIDTAGRLLIDRALRGDNGEEFSVDITVKNPLIGIGAPAGTYFPPVAKRLNTRLFISEHAGVGNAIGAAVGSVMQTVRALVRPMDWGRFYRTYLPSCVRDFAIYEEALTHTRGAAREMAKEQARRAGAAFTTVHVEQHDMVLADGGAASEDDCIETEIIATAAGRPRLGI